MITKLDRINRIYNISVHDPITGYNRRGIFHDTAHAFEALAMWWRQAGR